MTKYSVNPNFFSALNAESAFVAGFIAADGNVCYKNNRLNIKLAVKDLIILQYIKKKLQSTHKIHTYTQAKYTHVQLTIYNKKILEDLKCKFNVKPRKSLTYKPLNLGSKDLNGAFIKGLLLGDGWITVKKSGSHKKNPMLEVGICGSEATCAYFKWFRDKYYPSKRTSGRRTASIRKRTKANCFQYTFAGQSAYEFLQYLQQLPGLNLNRKFKKLDKFNSKGRAKGTKWSINL